MVAIFAIVMLMPFAAKAQIGATATIQGTITDPTGAVIPGATVTVKNAATNATFVQKTTKNGFYSISTLPEGSYTLTATATGFKKHVQKNITLNGMQIMGLNMKLSVGSATQTVTVSTAPPPLETQDATLGATLGGQAYKSLPLEMGASASPDQQRVTDFAALMPGVSANETHNNETDEPMVVNGQAHATEMYIEGIPFTMPGGQGDPRYIWPAFGVQNVSQFQLKTSAFSAEYSGLDVENFDIKAGTNQIHGSVYDLARNTAFDAYGFLPPVSVVTSKTYKPPEHMNEYGLDAGFPLIKDKLFFFGAFEGYRFSTVTPANYNTIPTQKMFQGDFSELLAQSTPIKIYDPLTQTCTATGCTRSQFVYNGQKNVIPPGEISPVAQQLAQFWKGIPYANSSLTKNFLGAYPYGLSNWDGSVRLDYDLSSKQTITGILATGRQGLVGPSATSTDMGPFPYKTAKYYRPITHVGILEDTYVISPNLVNQFKYGAAQYHSPDYNPTYPVSQWAASNWIGNLPTGQAGGGFSQEKFSGSFAPAQWGVDGGNIHNLNSFNLVDNLQWVHGNHSLSFGGEMQWLEENVVNAIGGSTPLALNFNGAQTAQFLSNSLDLAPDTGQPFASFMVGAVDSASYTYYAPISQTVGSRYHGFALYINDNYRATSHLTVNAGLRWDYMPPFREAQNRWSFMNPALINPITNTPGALEFAGNIPGVSCDCQTPVRTYLENFGPRLGIAWQLNSKTVLRAAYGVYYATGGGVNAGPAKNLGFSAGVSASSQGYDLPAFYLNGNPNATGTPGYQPTVQGLANDPENTAFGGGLPGTGIPILPIYNSAYGTYYSTNSNPYRLKTGVSYVDPWYGDRAPQFEGWNLGVQRLLTPNITATVSWVGNEAHFIPVSGARGLYGNQLNPIYLGLGATLKQQATSTNTPGGLPYPSFFGSTGTVGQALVPFPQYSGVSDEYESVGNSFYNALQLTITQRAVHGLTYTLNYTYSKNVDDAGTFRSGYALPPGTVYGTTKAFAQDRIDRSLSNIDIPQNLTIYGVYQLPFGRGHWGGENPVVSQIIGGWALSAIFQHQSGNPLEITSGNCDTPAGTCMPIYNPGFTGSARQKGGWGHGATAATLAHIQYINPNAFQTTNKLANPYVIGNTSRSAPDGLFAPGNYNFDGSLRRTFNIMPNERAKLVFEADVFNASNHVLFGSTSSNFTAAIGQQVTDNGSPKLGVVSGQSNQPRQWQFEAHLDF